MSEKPNDAQGGGAHTSVSTRGQTSYESVNRKPVPPADKGKDAYLFLASCCVLEAVVWGEFDLDFLKWKLSFKPRI